MRAPGSPPAPYGAFSGGERPDRPAHARARASGSQHAPYGRFSLKSADPEPERGPTHQPTGDMG